LAFEKLSLIRNTTLGFTLVCSTALAGLFAYLSFRVFRAGQWPPPGWRVVWEMRIRTGRQAAAVAVFFLFLAVMVIADAVWLWSLPGPVMEEEIGMPLEEV
jgi:multisubunit Na+/H+ antiporter MnhB subunit